MADVKVSGLPSDTSLDGNHYVPINDPSGPTTKRTLLSTLAAFFFNQVNIPDGSGSPRTRMTEVEFDFVASGLVWSGDAYASTRLASMTSGVVYINGRRLTISAVVSRTFTASRDTYVDILDNGDGTATVVYTEVTNNNASPALAANSIRIGIIVTGASNIASVGSINQGQQDKVLPIASSIAYAVTDSLGNLICGRDPNRRVLGLRQITSTFSTASTSMTAITGLSVPVKVPTGRRIRVTLQAGGITNNTQTYNFIALWEGTVGSGSKLSGGTWRTDVANSSQDPIQSSAAYTPSSSSIVLNGGMFVSAGTAQFAATAPSGEQGPAYVMVELI